MMSSRECAFQAFQIVVFLTASFNTKAMQKHVNARYCNSGGLKCYNTMHPTCCIWICDAANIWWIYVWHENWVRVIVDTFICKVMCLEVIFHTKQSNINTTIVFFCVLTARGILCKYKRWHIIHIHCHRAIDRFTSLKSSKCEVLWCRIM